MSKARNWNVVAFVVLVGLVTFLFFKTRMVDSNEHAEYLSSLRLLHDHDATLNQNILKARHAHLPHYDPINRDLAAMDSVYEQLRSVPGHVTPVTRSQITDLLAQFHGDLEAKQGRLNRFKSSNANLRNSISYLPTLIRNLQEGPERVRLGPELSQELSRLIEDVLIFNQRTDAELATRIRGAGKSLQDSSAAVTSAAVREDLQLALAHTQMILERKPEVEQLITEMLAMPTAAWVDRIHEVYTRDYQQAQARSNFYRLCLYAISVLFLGFVAYAFRAAYRANAQLEHRVEERTADLAASEERVRAVVSGVVDGIITIDEAGMIGSINPATEKIFGYQREEMVGQNVKMLMPEPYHGEHDGYLANYIRTGEAKVIGQGREVVGRRKDGSTFPMDLGISELHEGGERRFVGIVRDISERKKAEEALREAMEQAENANRTKSQFLANMSHELRTPLNAIIGYSEMLEEEAEDAGHQVYIEDLNKIHGSGKHLLGLINDVLDLSKIEAGKIEFYWEDFDLRRMLDEVASTVHPLVAKNGNELKIECDAETGSIRSDLTRVRQVLFNLLSNAAKFTEKGEITLRAERRRQAGGEAVVLAVSDTGIGMTEEQMEGVFEAFQQADASTTRKYGGTGLGLAISRRFCCMMGGDLSVASEVGVGTTFTAVVLDRAGRSEEGVESQAAVVVADAEDASRDTVLVIDDDPNVRELMLRYLDREGFNVVLSSNGEEGIELARECCPTAIVLDVMMPSMDGWAVLTRLKEDPELAGIPVVMQTMVEDKSLGYTLGASDYLIKPIDRDRLMETLDKYRLDRAECTIMVVEDDLNIREMVVRTLVRGGWGVCEAGNGREALEVLEKTEVQMILLDLMMPEMDGFEFVEAVQNGGKWDSIPIVVITAKDLTEEDRDRLNGQVHRVVQKGSYGRDSLLAEVSRQVKRQVQRNQQREESA